VTSPTTPESAVKNYRILSEPVTLDLYAENPPHGSASLHGALSSSMAR
jgi:hypothetical protein